MSEVTYSRDEAFKLSVDYFSGDELAADVFIDKYALRNDSNELIEATPDQMHRRLAREFARIEKNYPNPMSEDEIFSLFDKFRKVIPQGSPMSAIGNEAKLQSASNCFVIDPPLDSYSGILYTDQQEAQIMKRRGGVGFDISNIRPKGLKTKNAAGTTDGIGIFMERFSNTCREVAQNGRRGALMLSISCHHPEIMTFINIKRDLKKVTGANISIRWSDEFLNAVEKNEMVELRFPVEKEAKHIVRTMTSAKEIWDAFVDSAWASGEPGCLFWDTAIEKTPSDCYADVGFGSTSTNPSLQGDTLIPTKSGVKPIKWLAENEPVTFVRNIRGEWHPGRVFCSGRDKKLYKISFSNSNEVMCTAEHKWPIMNAKGELARGSDGSFSKIETKNLKRGDRIYFPRFEKPINNQECEYTSEDGFVVGWNVGDGWKCWHKTQNRQQYGFIFSKEDVESGIGDTVLSYCNEIAKRPSTLRQDHDCQAWTFVTTDANIRCHMEKFEITSKKDGIPRSIWGSNDAFIRGFIDGLFSSDGSVSIHKSKGLSAASIVLISSSFNLIKDVQKLLGLYGIRAGASKRQTYNSFPNGSSGIYTRCELKISGKHAAAFAQTFKLSNLKKAERLNTILAMDSSEYKNERNYMIVKEVTDTNQNEDVYDITVDDDTHTFQTCVGISGNCGEIVLSSKDSCRLITMNTSTYVRLPFTNKCSFDFKSFAEDTEKAQRLMDDLVDLEIELVDKIISKIKSDPEPDSIKGIELNLWNGIRDAAVNGRRTGLGVTAVGDTVASMGLIYGSKESIDLVEQIYKTLAVSSYKSSVTMAEERGAFPVFDFAKEDGHEFIRMIVESDKQLLAKYKKFGRRNIALTTTAPTGSVSTMTQTTSGIEPVFMTHYTRRKKINSMLNPDSRVDFIDAIGDKWQEYTVYHHGVKKWMEVSGDTDISKSPYHHATANEIDWKAGVDLQAAAQKWICHAISKTTNLPSTATKKDVNDVYWQGWKSGCKGITVYRDGCRSGVLVSADEKKEKNTDGRPSEIQKTNAPKRPEVLPCEIHHVTIKGTKWIILVGLLAGKPYEIFAGAAENLVLPAKLKTGRIVKIKQGTYNLHTGSGDEEMVVKNIVNTFDNPESAWATRMISMSLRHGVEVSFVTEQLSKDGVITDINKILSRVLKKYITDGSVGRGKCTVCGSTAVAYAEGCLTCTSCGSSKC